MEPAGGRPGDSVVPAVSVSGRRRMEPAKDRPDDLHAVAVTLTLHLAAMEPAENRLDDDREIPEALCQTEAAMEPTGPGRTTPVIHTYLSNDYVPQWSRPGNGRMTGLPDTGEIFLNTPQWSRPGNGRTTNRLVAGLGVLLLAAMEPAEERPVDSPMAVTTTLATVPQWSQPRKGWDDSARCSTTRSSSISRNGASRGLAG